MLTWLSVYSLYSFLFCTCFYFFWGTSCLFSSCHAFRYNSTFSITLIVSVSSCFCTSHFFFFFFLCHLFSYTLIYLLESLLSISHFPQNIMYFSLLLFFLDWSFLCRVGKKVCVLPTISRNDMTPETKCLTFFSQLQKELQRSFPQPSDSY